MILKVTVILEFDLMMRMMIVSYELSNLAAYEQFFIDESIDLV